MTDPSDTPALDETSKTETTVRQFDADGQVISEVTTTIETRKTSWPGDLPTGMYL